MLRRGLLTSLSFVYLLCFSLTVLGLDEPYFECGTGEGPQDLHGVNGVMQKKYFWEQKIPVVLDPSYTHKEHAIIVGGLNEIMQKTCIEFDIYDNEAEVEENDFVYINKNTKRGRIGGKQEIGLPKGCISHRTAMHEMLHALGFRHEHVRYDRDDYIIVLWGNIRRGRESNFKKRSPSDLVSGPYDYESIMHYERKAFSANGMETIRPLKAAKIGVRQQMSYWDAQKVNIVYKCGGRYSNSDVSNLLLEHSPALFQYNEGHDHNESLPIAEYDDFNREPVTSPSHGHAAIHSRPDQEEGHEDPHPYHDQRPRPPQPHRHGHNPNFNGNERDNELHSYPDDHYGNNENNNRIHYRNNQPHHYHHQHLDNRPQRREQQQFNRNPEQEDFLTYTETDSSPNINNNNNNNNGEPFYDDFYDF